MTNGFGDRHATIASQVNPHVVPFMQDDIKRYRKDMLSWPERIIRRQEVISIIYTAIGDVAKLVDALDLGSSAAR